MFVCEQRIHRLFENDGRIRVRDEVS